MAPSGAYASPFDRILHYDEDRREYWSARELAKTLGYSGWQRFSMVVQKAKIACENSGQASLDHFNASVKLIRAGKGAMREIEDWHLSRYACYLIAQNSDPAKQIAAQAQTYFATQTRRQELADEAASLDYADMSEDQRRNATDGYVELSAGGVQQRKRGRYGQLKAENIVPFNKWSEAAFQQVVDAIRARLYSAAPKQSSASDAAAGRPDIPAQIAALARLRDQGVLSEAEFAAKKAELLSRL